MSRSLEKIVWYIESKAARNEGVRLNNVEAKALARYLDVASNSVAPSDVDLLAALEALRDAVKDHPALQGREYVGLGIQVNNAINRAKGA